MMQLRISYFNSSVLRKNLSRFAPVWGLYALGLFLVMSAFYNDDPRLMASSLTETTGTLSYVNFAYAFLCATMLFGDLFQSRMCNALHAMPLRRIGWYLTHIASGILFALIPNLLLSAVAAALLQEYAFLAIWWFLCTMGQFLFHFALAVLCAMCVGTRFAHALVYGILCFLSLLVYWIVSAILEPLLYGIQLDMTLFRFACPTVFFGDNSFFIWNYSSNTGKQFKGFDISVWTYLAICAGIGALVLVLAFFLYRRRKLETAGDFLSITKLRPVFLLLYTLTAGTVFYTFGEIFTSGARYIFLFIGLITGFYTGRMLLERSLKVFQWKSNLACFLFLLFIGATLAVTYLDPLGITKWIPNPADVKSVSINFSYSTSSAQPLTDSEDIDAVTVIHKKLLESNRQTDGGYWINLHYKLKNGRTVERTYFTSIVKPDLKATITPILSRWDTVFPGITQKQLLENLHFVYTGYNEGYNKDFPREAYGELLDALAQDCENGNMAQAYGLHLDDPQVSWLEIQYDTHTDSGIRILYLDIYESCTNTVAVLKKYAPQSFNDQWTK